MPRRSFQEITGELVISGVIACDHLRRPQGHATARERGKADDRLTSASQETCRQSQSNQPGGDAWTRSRYDWPYFLPLAVRDPSRLDHPPL